MYMGCSGACASGRTKDVSVRCVKRSHAGKAAFAAFAPLGINAGRELDLCQPAQIGAQHLFELGRTDGGHRLGMFVADRLVA